MNMKSSERSKELMKRLLGVVETLNNEVTRLTEKKLVDAITERVVDAKSSTTYSRVEGLKERRLDASVNVSWKVEGGREESHRSKLVINKTL